MTHFNEKHFKRYHREQLIKKKHDVFLVWTSIIFISVLSAQLFFDFATDAPTGLITGAGTATGEGMGFIGTFFMVFIAITIIAVIHMAVTKNDY